MLATRFNLRVLLLPLLALLPAACGNVNFFSESYENTLGADAYVQATAEFPVVTGTAEAQMVQRIGQKIAAASGKDYEWEFKLLDAPDTVNAFCLPGGKVAVYTGILPITQNENGLAVVMGHEVAHATERHGGQRMTQGLIAQAITAAAAVGLSLSDMDEDTQLGIMAAVGAGAQYGYILPYSRDHETEADELGVRYLIRAGYDPWEAPKLWERMAQLNPDRPPAWLSTHPDPQKRADNLRQKIPQFLAEQPGR